MIKPIAAMVMMLVTATGPALAQGGNPSPALLPQKQPPAIGPTGTMYDGNNAQLQLPPGRNAWYEDRWAGYQPQTQSTWYFGAGDLWYAGRWAGYEPNLGSSSAGPTSAVGAGAAGSSLRGTTGAGER